MSRMFGRRAPKRAAHLQLSQFLKAIPSHPTAVDYLKNLKNWQMLGNDNFGDCVAVMAANGTRLVTSALATEYYPTIAEVYSLYRTQNPNFNPDPNRPVEDNGMDIQTMLEYWQKNAWGGRKIIAFASVDHTNLEELKAAIAIFGFVLPGINVLSANETQFDNGKPWDYVKGSPVVGGHAILAGGYNGQSKSDIDFITWAKETSFTDAEVAKEWEECWIAIFPEHFGAKSFQQGIDVNALANAFQALTGNVLPVPAPVPIPSGTWQITSQTATRIILDLK